MNKPVVLVLAALLALSAWRDFQQAHNSCSDCQRRWAAMKGWAGA